MKELPALPKLPHGEGSFSYHHKKGITSIRLRKRINGKPEDVYGSSTKECLKKMKEKERSILEKAKYYHPTDGLGVVLLQDAMVHWLETYKKPMMKNRSYDTIESTFMTHIMDTSIGRTAIENVQSEDVQRVINELITKKSLSTTKKVFSLMSQFFAYYYARDINNNPMLLVSIPKKHIEYTDDEIMNSEELSVLTDEEIELLTQELSKSALPHSKRVWIPGIVPSSSMEPTLHIGDWGFANGAAYLLNEPQRGDIIVFYSDEYKKLMIKRVIGLPGETVSFYDGYVYINDGLLYEEYCVLNIVKKV